jgi:hypothetical protein
MDATPCVHRHPPIIPITALRFQIFFGKMEYPLPIIHHVKKNSTRIPNVISSKALGLRK